MPKPFLSLLKLSFPVASSDLGADALENENSMHLTQVSSPPLKMPPLYSLSVKLGFLFLEKS
jgi:chromosome transmission fidelity protein 4